MDAFFTDGEMSCCFGRLAVHALRLDQEAATSQCDALPSLAKPVGKNMILVAGIGHDELVCSLCKCHRPPCESHPSPAYSP